MLHACMHIATVMHACMQVYMHSYSYSHAYSWITYVYRMAIKFGDSNLTNRNQFAKVFRQYLATIFNVATCCSISSYEVKRKTVTTYV